MADLELAVEELESTVAPSVESWHSEGVGGAADPENVADQSEAGSDSRSPSRQTADRAKRALVRKAVNRTIDIASLQSPKAMLLATLLGVADPTDVAAVTVAALEAGRAQREVLRRLTEIAGAEAMDAGVLAVGLFEERALFRSAWGVLAALGEEMPATPPAVQTKAGLALAKAAKKLDVAKLADLEALSALIG
jgi:hypothetical protein